jgi:2OG-Fe(II) oxygenase superfamily
MIDCVEEANGVFSLSLFGSDECRSFIKYLKGRSRWDPAEIGIEDAGGEVRSVVDAEFRSATVLSGAEAPLLWRKLDAKMKRVVRPLVRRIWGLDLSVYDGTQFVRYQTGGEFKAHADAALDLEGRYFTLLCYLNDNYEGGRTSFPYLQNFTIAPRCGKAVLFPAKYVHRAEPVLRGEKYVVVTWMLGPVPVKWI